MNDGRPVFARHESFYPRVGWLWKAVTHSGRAGGVFLQEDATVKLGVGKNMVRAIRYWGSAMRLIEEYADPEHPRRRLARPTPLGTVLFGGEGWDPYLEDPRTTWLLHWMLTRSPSGATAWQLLFGLWSRTDFSEHEAVEWLHERTTREADWPDIADASLRRDVQCILQMYGPPRRHGRKDDLVESPFREIGLLVPSAGDETRWRFVYGPKPGLTAAIVGFACLDYAARETSGSTVTISRLALEPYSPGLMMRLNESQITKALESLATAHHSIEVIAPAGVRQLAFREDPSNLAVRVLATAYGKQMPADRVDDLLKEKSSSSNMEAA